MDGTIVCRKAHLVARGFTQAYGIDYTETFSHVVSLHFIRMLLSLTINQAWSLHQLDVSNIVVYDDLEDIFIEQLFGYIAQGEHPRCVFYVELLICSSRVHTLGLQSLVSLALASHHESPILPCLLRRIRALLSFLKYVWMIFF